MTGGEALLIGRGWCPGLEAGAVGMMPGGRRRLTIPPELVGPYRTELDELGAAADATIVIELEALLLPAPGGGR